MKLIIAAFFQHMPPFTGGAALRGQSIIASLAQLTSCKNGRPKVYCTTPNPSPILGATIETLDVPEVENTMSLKRRLVGEVQMGYVAAKCMFRSGEAPTLAVVSSPGYISAAVQIFFARLYGVPYVLDVRDIYPQVYAEANLLRRDSLIYRVFQRVSRLMYIKAELVICATQGLAREVSREAPTACVTHVYNGFPANLAERRSDKHCRFTVCFHGVLGFFQDVETLLNVSERLALYDIEVVVIGYGRKEASLQNCTLSNLRFLGRQSFENTIQEVERCHMGLCLRMDDEISKDAFPVKVWEYIGLGIPCIVTPPCEAGDFLEKHACGVVVESGNVDEIVATVLRAKDEADYLKGMVSNCRQLSMSYTREQLGLVAAQEIYKVALRCAEFGIRTRTQ